MWSIIREQGEPIMNTKPEVQTEQKAQETVGQTPVTSVAVEATKKGRGRPKGSKNKVKEATKPVAQHRLSAHE